MRQVEGRALKRAREHPRRGARRGAAGSRRANRYAKLRPGPGLPASEVVANQLIRLRTAMVELVDARGYRAMTVRELCSLAGVSTRTFYEFFAGKEACLLRTYESILRELAPRLRAAVESGDAPRQRLRLAFGALVEAVESNPAAARLALLEAPAAGPSAAGAVRGSEARLAAIVEACFAGPGPERPPELFSRAIVAGATHVLRSRLTGGGPRDPRKLAGELADWAHACGGRVAAVSADLDAGSEPSRSLPPRLRDARRLGDERALILSAASNLAIAEGYGALSVSSIRAAAGVTRRHFEEHFDSVDDCFLTACAELTRRSLAGAAREAAAERRWLAGLRRMLLALFAQMARNPRQARFALLDVTAPGREGVRVRAGLVDDAAALLLTTIGIEPAGAELGVQASVGAVWEIACRTWKTASCGSCAASRRRSRSSWPHPSRGRAGRAGQPAASGPPQAAERPPEQRHELSRRQARASRKHRRARAGPSFRKERSRAGASDWYFGFGAPVPANTRSRPESRKEWCKHTSAFPQRRHQRRSLPVADAVDPGGRSPRVRHGTSQRRAMTGGDRSAGRACRDPASVGAPRAARFVPLGSGEQLRGAQSERPRETVHAFEREVAPAALDVGDPALVQAGIVGELLLGEAELEATLTRRVAEGTLERRTGAWHDAAPSPPSARSSMTSE